MCNPSKYNSGRTISQNFAIQDLSVCPERNAFYSQSSDCGSAFLHKLKICFLKKFLFSASPKSFVIPGHQFVIATSDYGNQICCKNLESEIGSVFFVAFFSYLLL